MTYKMKPAHQYWAELLRYYTQRDIEVQQAMSDFFKERYIAPENVVKVDD